MKKYEKPSLTIIVFDVDDIITSSSNIVSTVSDTQQVSEVNWSDILNNLFN